MAAGSRVSRWAHAHRDVIRTWYHRQMHESSDLLVPNDSDFEINHCRFHRERIRGRSILLFFSFEKRES